MADAVRHEGGPLLIDASYQPDHQHGAGRRDDPGGLWFDGHGMVHAVRIEGGRATYRNRWVRTPSLDDLVPAFGRAEEPASAGLVDLGADGLLA